MEDGLVVPVWVDLGQLGGNPVVLPEVDGVQGGQGGLLASPRIPGYETFSRLCLQTNSISELCGPIDRT